MKAMMTQYKKMDDLVKKAHHNQKYGDKPYTYHLRQVDLLVTEVNCVDQILECCSYSGIDPDGDNSYAEAVWTLKTIALGHDVDEDTYVTEDILKGLGFSEIVISAILDLSKKEGQTKKEYLENLCKNPWAKCVKKADSFANLLNSLKDGRVKGIKKYTHNLQVLGGVEAVW